MDFDIRNNDNLQQDCAVQNQKIILSNVQLQGKLADCFEQFVSVTAAVSQTEFRERHQNLKIKLAELSDAIKDRACGQTRVQGLHEMSKILNQRIAVLQRMENAWNYSQGLIQAAEGGGGIQQNDMRGKEENVNED